MFLNKTFPKQRLGFTLVEILVVVVIIGVLATLTTVSVNSVRSKARDTKRISDVRQIQLALEMYRDDNGKYPDSVVIGTPLSSNGITYLAKVPKAPGVKDGVCTADTYTYTSRRSGGSYVLAFCLGGVVSSAGPSNCYAVPGEICLPTYPYDILEIGPAGGRIFYNKGNNDGGWQYLEAAPSTTEWSSVQWSATPARISGATSTEIGAGKANTQAILAVLAAAGESGRPAQLADQLIVPNNNVDYDDWFLPSANELRQMYVTLKIENNNIGGFNVGTHYWSSSQCNTQDNSAEYQDVTGTPPPRCNLKTRYIWYNVRAIRAF